MEPLVEDNPDRNRFEMVEDGAIARSPPGEQPPQRRLPAGRPSTAPTVVRRHSADRASMGDYPADPPTVTKPPAPKQKPVTGPGAKKKPPATILDPNDAVPNAAPVGPTTKQLNVSPVTEALSSTPTLAPVSIVITGPADAVPALRTIRGVAAADTTAARSIVFFILLFPSAS